MKRKQAPALYAPSTVKKALSILSVLAKEKEGLGMMDLARRLDLNRSTVYRLLSALVEGGFVTQSPTTQKYCLGLRIIELAGLMLADMEVREVARPYLQELAQFSGETANLGILNEAGEIVYIDKIDGPEAVRLLTSVGKTLPAYVTSMGKAIMAYLSEDELDRALGQQSFQARTENTITSEEAFREHLKLVRDDGYAADYEENRLTASCIGAPVFDATGKVVAAISIAGPSFRMTDEKMKELSATVISTASKISINLGCQVEIGARKMGLGK